MNYPSVRFVFDRKHHATRTTKGLVQVEVLYQRRRKWIGTGIHLYKHQWDEKRHVINSPTVIDDNETLDAIMQRVKEIIHGIIKETGGFSFQIFSRNIDRAKQKESFLDFVRKRAINHNLSESRKLQYIGAYKKLCEYGKILSFEDVTLDSIEDFNRYLLEYTALKVSSIKNYHNIIKSSISDAVRNGYLKENPYDNFTMPKLDSEPRAYLTSEELHRFMNVSVKPPFQVYKDFFIVQCYTGLSFSDLTAFSKDCIDIRRDKVVLIGKRIKTSVNFYVVLMKPVIDILEKYDYKFPRITIKTLNYHIKKIAEEAGIKKVVSSHVGRHTFAVFALSNGVAIETVAKILGHTDIKTTQIYAKIIDKSVEDSFEKLELAL